jgi:hypothetical protein
MSDALSFAELEGQHVELLPARTVMSNGGGVVGIGGTSNGGAGTGGLGINLLSGIGILGSGTANAGNGVGGAGGGADGIEGK